MRSKMMGGVTGLIPLQLGAITASGPGLVSIGGSELGLLAAQEMQARLSIAIAEAQCLQAASMQGSPWEGLLSALDAQWAHASPCTYTHVATRQKAQGRLLRVQDGRRMGALLRVSNWGIARLSRNGARWAGFIATATPQPCFPAWAPDGQPIFLDCRIVWTDTLERISVAHADVERAALTDGCGRRILKALPRTPNIDRQAVVAYVSRWPSGCIASEIADALKVNILDVAHTMKDLAEAGLIRLRPGGGYLPSL